MILSLCNSLHITQVPQRRPCVLSSFNSPLPPKFHTPSSPPQNQSFSILICTIVKWTGRGSMVVRLAYTIYSLCSSKTSSQQSQCTFWCKFWSHLPDCKHCTSHHPLSRSTPYHWPRQPSYLLFPFLPSAPVICRAISLLLLTCSCGYNSHTQLKSSSR